jgi:hypothetical protein
VRDLVTTAYAKVLGRSPDAAGLSHYSSCIVDGELKTRGMCVCMFVYVRVYACVCVYTHTHTHTRTRTRTHTHTYS